MAIFNFAERFMFGTIAALAIAALGAVAFPQTPYAYFVAGIVKAWLIIMTAIAIYICLRIAIRGR